MYKKASQLRLRFKSKMGLLSTDQLWDLSRATLTTMLKDVRKVLKVEGDDTELSFLESTKSIDIENQLRFDILKDVYLTKKRDADNIRNKAEINAHNQKIDALIAEKQEGKLREMSIEELEKLRK